jgi:anti-sigma B factor antagonist
VTYVAKPDLDWEPFRCEVMPDGDRAKVTPFGEIDLATAGEVEAQLAPLWNDGLREVVLDLSQVTFIDSSGLRVVVEAGQAAARHRVAFTVLPGPPAVQRAFEFTGLAPRFFT